MTRVLLALAFLATILAANWATTQFGLITIAGLTATAGTLFAGLAFVLRDSVQDLTGRAWVLALIIIGACLSWLVADPAIALASGAAFACSELADYAVYTPLRSSGYVRAAVASNIVGAFVDTIVFLSIAGFPVRANLVTQMTLKLTVTVVAVAIVFAWRLSRRVAS